MVVALVLSTIASLSAQNSANTTRSPEFSENAELIAPKSQRSFTEGSSLLSPSVIQAVASARRALAEGKPAYSTQDTSPQDDGPAVDLKVVRNASSFRKVAVGTGAQTYEIEANSLESGLAQMAAVHRESAKRTEAADCKAVALSVEQRIMLDVSKVLEIVESEVGANPSCACEIVKMAITASNADVAKVVSIVETAIIAAPDSMRIISQCAIATAPDSIAQVQALLAELDPNTGDADGYSSKSAKSAKGAKDAEVAAIVAPPIENPLDRPFFPTFIPPPVIIPPHVTKVNPGGHRF
jgi:hypothetical protein